MDSCNSVGGVSLRFNIQNKSSKTIKYARLYFTPYNAVDDPVACQISQLSQKIIKVAGPINAEEISENIISENVWYNITIKKAILDKVEIDYMDGTSKEFNSAEIDLSRPVNNKSVATSNPSPESGLSWPICIILLICCPLVGIILILVKLLKK